MVTIQDIIYINNIIVLCMGILQCKNCYDLCYTTHTNASQESMVAVSWLDSSVILCFELCSV